MQYLPQMAGALHITASNPQNSHRKSFKPLPRQAAHFSAILKYKGLLRSASQKATCCVQGVSVLGTRATPHAEKGFMMTYALTDLPSS